MTKRQLVFNDETERLMLQNRHELQSCNIKFILDSNHYNMIKRFAKAITVSTYINELTIEILPSYQHHDDDYADTNDDSILTLTECIQSCSNIQRVGLRSNVQNNDDQYNIRQQIILSIAKNESICCFSFCNHYMDWNELQIILSSKYIQTLNFCFVHLIDYNNSIALDDTIRAFTNNKSLKEMNFTASHRDIHHNDITLSSDQGYAAIITAAKTNTSITKLYYYKYNVSGRANLDPLVTDAMTELFAASTNKVSDLQLGNFYFDDHSFPPIAAIIKNTKRITAIKFQQCLFNDSACHLLRECLRDDNHGERISINIAGSTMPFGRTSYHIMQYLASGPGRLTALDLSQWANLINMQDDELQKVFNELLKCDCNIKTLTLPILSSKQMIHLLEAIPKFHHNLHHLELLIDSNISETQQKEFLSAIHCNSTITTLKVSAFPSLTQQDALLKSITVRNQILSQELKETTATTGKNTRLLPLFFRASSIATAAVGPYQILTSLTVQRDNLCNPNNF